MQPKYALDSAVTIIATGQKGTVTGVAAYKHSEPQALVEHVNGHGDLVETWFFEDTITATWAPAPR